MPAYIVSRCSFSFQGRKLGKKDSNMDWCGPKALEGVWSYYVNGNDPGSGRGPASGILYTAVITCPKSSDGDCQYMERAPGDPCAAKGMVTPEHFTRDGDTCHVSQVDLYGVGGSTPEEMAPCDLSFTAEWQAGDKSWLLYFSNDRGATFYNSMSPRQVTK